MLDVKRFGTSLEREARRDRPVAPTKNRRGRSRITLLLETIAEKGLELSDRIITCVDGWPANGLVCQRVEPWGWNH